MKLKMKKISMNKTAAIAVAALLITSASVGLVSAANAQINSSAVQTTIEKSIAKTPKYIFMFIGDGMIYPQI